MGSRIGAWASPQSDVVASREALEALERATRDRFDVVDDATPAAFPRPPFWGGYRLVPTLIEFWQGRPSRLHDRIAFRGGDERWVVERLAP